MTSNNLLNLILVRCRTSFGLRIINIDMIRDHLIDDNLIFILFIQSGSDESRTLFISIYISYAGGVFVRSFKREFMFDRGVTNSFKKMVKR